MSVAVRLWIALSQSHYLVVCVCVCVCECVCVLVSSKVVSASPDVHRKMRARGKNVELEL